MWSEGLTLWGICGETDLPCGVYVSSSSSVMLSRKEHHLGAGPRLYKSTTELANRSTRLIRLMETS